MKTFPSPDCSGKRDMSADGKGKVRTVKPNLEYIYDAMGNRIARIGIRK